jgi:hypothetical protein
MHDQDDQDPGPASAYYREVLGAPSVTQILQAIRTIRKCRQICLPEGECRPILDQALEVLYGLHDQMVRLSNRRPRHPWREKE